MKRAVVFVIFQTGARANGGLESITELMRRLKDHRPIVVTNLDSPASKLWRDSDFEVHVVPEEASAGLARNPLRTLQSYRRYHGAVAQILAASKARVVHANDPLAFQLSVSAVKGAQAHIVLNLRDTLDPARKPPRLKFGAIFAATDHVLYLSADMAERWREVAPNATRSFSVTYSIVDPERFAPSPPPAGGTPVALVPAVFWSKKGQLEFVHNVVPALAEQGVESWFAGDFEPETDRYAAACASAAEPFAGAVRFLGFRSDLPDLYRRASVVAVPSKHEGLMRGMIEAMSCGRPVVSFDVCSAREVLEEKSGGAGIVVPAGDYAGMAGALVRFAADRGAQVEAGRKASVAARELFDPGQVVERYERVYRELAGQ